MLAGTYMIITGSLSTHRKSQWGKTSLKIPFAPIQINLKHAPCESANYAEHLGVVRIFQNRSSLARNTEKI